MQRADTEYLSPGEAAARTGLTIETLRYYEREGLIHPVRRAAGGRRAYTSDDIAWIGLLTCLRAAGLGIADLRSFTVMLRQDSASGDRVDFLRGRREALLQRQRAIAVAVGVLDEKIAHYTDNGLDQQGEGKARATRSTGTPTSSGEDARP